MVSQTIIFLFFGSVIFLLVLINAVLFWYSHRANKRIDVLLEKGKIKDFKDVILRQKERNDGLEEEIKKAFLRIEDLEELSQKVIQKTSFTRFNPFNDLGGNQSFVIVLLDKKDNGFVISSLFSKEGNRVYAKAVKKGKSDQMLSKEEKEAIEKALGRKPTGEAIK